jgi:predicted O-methyltransferase YrrM
MLRRDTADSVSFSPLDHPIAFDLPHYLQLSAWMGHLPFGMLLVSLTRPRILVELGTHSGVSFMGFCQAVHTLGLETRCYAVDTWQGDDQAGHYDESVFVNLAAYNAQHYDSFARLLRMTFDEALPYFADGSIDLLHIDGMHTYDAVRHDFESWLPKLSARGVVLFHDINVRERDFGVWRLWDELKTRWPSFEVYNDHGLGVLAVGADVPEPVRALCALDGVGALRLRSLLAALADRIHGRFRLEEARAALAQQQQLTEQYRQWHAIALGDADALRARVQQMESDWQALEQANLSLHDQIQRQTDQIRALQTQLEEDRNTYQAALVDLDRQRLTALSQQRAYAWQAHLYARDYLAMARVFGRPYRVLRKGGRALKRIVRPNRTDNWNYISPAFFKLRDDTTLFIGYDPRWRLQLSEDFSPPGSYVFYRIPGPTTGSIAALQFAVVYTGAQKDGAIGVELVIDERIVAQKLHLLDPLDLNQPVTLNFPPVEASGHTIEIRLFSENVSGELRVFELRRSVLGKLLRRPFIGIVLA